MNDEQQMGFGFLPDLPLAVVNPKKAKRRTTPVQPVEAHLAAAPPVLTQSVEDMARVVEAHPDYRVLRRLVPRLQWTGTATGSTWRVLILDTETTGLDAGKEAIIELALLAIDVDMAHGVPVGVVDVYDGLEDPGKAIPKEVVALTGITDADVRGQHLDETRVAHLLAGADLVIAHNAGFDRPFVEARIPAFAQVPWACSFADLDWKAQGHNSAKLENLAQAHGWFYDAHRAEMDCHALLAVLAQALPKGEGSGLAHLWRASQSPSYRVSATHAPFEAKELLKSRGYRWNTEQRVWQIRLGGPESLQAELAWLKERVYAHRAAFVQVEVLDACTKFSHRAGAISQHKL